MKRDLELIKAILLQLEATDRLDEIPNYSKVQLKYHISLLFDAEMIVREEFFDSDIGPGILSRIRMTWVGHEFLDSSRNPSIWEKAKKITLEKTGALSFEILKTVLTQLAKEAVSTTAT